MTTSLLEPKTALKKNLHYKKILLTKEPDWEKIEAFNRDCCLDEPPAWHEAVLEERAEEWEQRKTLSRNWDEAIKDLKKELGIEF